jgi:Glycosyl transferase family 2
MNEAPGRGVEQRFDGDVARALVPILVIIPARRTDRTVPACLSALRASRGAQQFDIVLVHDGTDVDQKGLSVRQLHSPVLNSAAAARNLGAAEHRHGILVFVDADVLVDEQSVRLLVNPILSGSADATVGNYSQDVQGLTFIQSYKQLHPRRGTSRGIPSGWWIQSRVSWRMRGRYRVGAAADGGRFQGAGSAQGDRKALAQFYPAQIGAERPQEGHANGADHSAAQK